ncbi:MAG: ribonuclease R [Lachnospiraceae bacterium]|nr:ribonuclease R [Lachnospiraceae bacterium]
MSNQEAKNRIYQMICDPLYVPMKIKEMAILLDLPKERRGELQEILDELEAEGKIERSVKNKYHKAEKKYIVGSFVANARGFGFVEVDDEETPDYFIPEKYTMGAFHGDVVRMELLPESRGMRPEGRIVAIIEHGITEVVGTFQASDNFGFLIPDDPKIPFDIFIPKFKDRKVMTGHKCVARIVKYAEPGKKPEGEIVEILGHVNDPGVDILSLVKAFGLPMEFSEEVLREAEAVAEPVVMQLGREDLRDVTMVTIDGEDSKDLDDAVSICRVDGGYELGVHIADVSEYVREGSALDVEALKRSTSVYLADRVIPMLPHVLCNGICSLNAGEDRNALSCIMTIDAKGNVVDHRIVESVVRIDRRMTYTAVNEILEDKNPDTLAEYEDLVTEFKLMEECANILRHKRKKRGSIDFDFPETKIELDERGNVVGLHPYERRIGQKMIEDFMLLANETVAEHFHWQEVPFLYRVHGEPDGEKIQRLAALVGSFGYTLRGKHDEIHPKELQKLLVSIEGSSEEDLIRRLTLRSMQQAKYDPECIGHFGLAAEFYCHFTSPIRRYPDLQIHRIIKESIRGTLDEARMEHYQAILPEVAAQTSKLERRADEVEREVEKLKKVQYMKNYIGKTYHGVISGVTKWGIYVELPNTVEGMIRLSELTDDEYELHEDTYELVGKNFNKHYKLGQDILIQVVRADEVSRTIDFVMAGDEDNE